MIPLVKILLSDNQDFFFHPTLQANMTFYSPIIDYKSSKILVKNAFNRSHCVFRQNKLDQELDMAYKSCFLINIHLAFDAPIVSPFLHSFSNLSTWPTLLPMGSLMEIVFKNGIKIYKDASVVRQIFILVAKCASILESQSFVQISLKR